MRKDVPRKWNRYRKQPKHGHQNIYPAKAEEFKRLVRAPKVELNRKNLLWDD
jgi:hypothetical protein